MAISEQLRQEIVSRYKTEIDLSIAKLSKQIGVSEISISKILKKANVPIRSTNYQRLPLDPVEVNRLYDSGLSTYKLAKMFGCTPTTINRLIVSVRPAMERNRLSSESIDKIAIKSKQLWLDETYRAKVKAGTSTDVYRDKLRATSIANYPSTLGKWMASVEAKAIISQRVRECWTDPKFRQKQEIWFQSRGQNLTAGFKKLLANPERRAKWIDSMRRSSVINRCNTGWISSAQRQLYYILSMSGIEYYEEGANTQVGPFYVVDCIIPKQQTMARSLIVEVQGEYWHSLKHVMIKDRQKASYVRNQTDYDLLTIDELELAPFPQTTAKLASYGLSVTSITCRTDEIMIKQISEADASVFYSIFHYTGTVRKGAITFGAFYDNKLVAAISYTYPLRLESATRLKLAQSEMMEISRLARQTNVVCRNLSGYLIGKSRKLLKTMRPDVKCLLSFADSTHKHRGHVYKVVGFDLDAVLEPDYFYASLLGKFHKKTIWDRSKRMKMTESEYADKHGLIKVHGMPKTRWIYWY